jgi:hypothetical protein
MLLNKTLRTLCLRLTPLIARRAQLRALVGDATFGLFYFSLMTSPLVPSCSLAPRDVERMCMTTPS